MIQKSDENGHSGPAELLELNGKAEIAALIVNESVEINAGQAARCARIGLLQECQAFDQG
jgi:hypothetical protein